MKITFLLPAVNMSGGIRVAAIHAKNLMKMGHDVTMVSSAPQKPPIRTMVRQLLKAGSWVKYEKAPRSHLDGTGLRHVVVSHGGPITENDIPPSDVIIATWWETAEWLMTWSDSCGAKVYFIQAHEIFDYLPKDRVEKTYFSSLHKITISSWLHELMLNIYDAPQCDLVPNAVDHDQFNAPIRDKNSKPTIGFVCNSTGLKGLDVALAVVSKLFDYYPDLEVFAFGGKPDPNYRFDSRIKLFESPPQDKIKNIYASCDVWLSTSRTEGFGLTTMEAMACRTPVVSTKTGWAMDGIVNGANGYVNEIDDVHGLIESSIKILNLEKNQWKKMSQCAYDTVKGCNWWAATQLFEAALMRAVTQISFKI